MTPCGALTSVVTVFMMFLRAHEGTTVTDRPFTVFAMDPVHLPGLFPADLLRRLGETARLDGPDEADMFADEWWATAAEAPPKKRIAVRRKPSDEPAPITGDLFGY